MTTASKSPSTPPSSGAFFTASNLGGTEPSSCLVVPWPAWGPLLPLVCPPGLPAWLPAISLTISGSSVPVAVECSAMKLGPRGQPFLNMLRVRNRSASACENCGCWRAGTERVQGVGIGRDERPRRRRRGSGQPSATIATSPVAIITTSDLSQSKPSIAQMFARCKKGFLAYQT
jgi:hypothetical protein